MDCSSGFVAKTTYGDQSMLTTLGPELVLVPHARFRIVVKASPSLPAA